jgi:hypothetical protein
MEQRESNGVLKGLMLVWASNVIHVGANFFLWATPINKFAMKYFAISQLVYVVPLALYARNHDLPERLKGIVIAASITFLLSSMCFFSGW